MIRIVRALAEALATFIRGCRGPVRVFNQDGERQSLTVSAPS